METRISYESTNIEQLIADAETLWKWTKKQPSSTSLEKMHEHVTAHHAKLRQAHPIVVQYMLAERKYTRRALKQYLKIMMEKYIKQTEEDFVASQAEYVVEIYKDENPRWQQVHLRAIRLNTREYLQKELDEYKAIQANAAAMLDQAAVADRAKLEQSVLESINAIMSSRAQHCGEAAIEIE